MRKHRKRSSQAAFVRACAALALAIAPNSASAQSSTTYTYDALGRLTVSSHSGGASSGVSSTYSYDPAGNRSQVVTSMSGGNCAFSVRDGNFSYDWEFPSNSYWVWIDISGACTSPTTMQYTFSRPGVSPGTFVVQPSQTSYYFYDIPTPCAFGGSGSATTKISIVSGPGTIADDEGAVGLFCE